ncbi:MAG: uroporphyrinogen-III synthase [bacterium]|jgi:uroporphyrinogen-III synthase|nr:uroporphyrinogen-III synthase [bacterium]
MSSLHGQRIIITRQAEEQDEAARLVREAGGSPIACPVLSIRWPNHTAPLDHAIRHVTEFDWLFFTSGNSVRFFWNRFGIVGVPRAEAARCRIAVIGTATEAALEAYGRQADFVAAEATGDAFIEEFGLLYPVSGVSFLLPLSHIARTTIADTLKIWGARVKQVVTYCNEPVEALPADVVDMLQKGEGDWVLFTSSSTVNYFLSLLPPSLRSVSYFKAASIGPKTSETLRKHGIEPAAETMDHTLPGLLEAIANAYT